MASVPGYYLSSPAAIVYLPVVEAHEANLGEQRMDLLVETDGGKRWVYNQFVREMVTVTFRNLTTAQLAAFRTMHDTVQGQGLPFYYVTSDAVTLYVRKQKDFLYARTKSRTMYDVRLELSAEPSDASLLV